MESSLNHKIAAIIEAPIADMGYALVQIRMLTGGKSTLQIMAERKDEKNMTVEDCAAISRTVSALLDVEDPIKEMYTLEISSPGIDRPLVKLEDFARFAHFEAKLETRMQLEGRKRFKGRIKAVEGEEIVMEADKETYRIPYHMVQSAKLLLTDELIDRHGKSAAAAN